MKNIVIDTNVIISSLITPNGKPAQVIEIVKNSMNMEWIYSDEIFAEYKRVLGYAKVKLAPEMQTRYLNGVKSAAILIFPTKSNIPFTDKTDRKFYDTAVASGALLITGNGKHFPAEDFILSPAEFVERYL